jgi:PKD repeat protein
MKNKGLILAALLLGLFSQAFAAPSTPPIKEAKSAKVTNGYDPTIRAEHQRALYYQLWAEKLPLQETAVSVQLTAEEAAGLSDKANGGFTRSPLELRQRVGIVKPVSHQVDLRGFSADGLPLAPTPTARGVFAAHPRGATWSAVVEAVDATALRLHFTAFRLPANARLYIYNDDGQVDGPYTDTGRNGSGSFWSRTIAGSTAYVQVQFDGPVSDADLRGMHFVIADVAHVGPLFRIVDLWQTCRATASCVWQLSEYEIGHTAHAAVNDARTAAAHMQFVSGPYVYMCSGGLLNDTGDSGRNYFLTANHCVSKGGEASSLETFFLYTDCGGDVVTPTPTPPGTVGSQILRSSRTSDFTLLELNGAVPLGTSRLGWTTDTVARNKDEPMLYRISHPNGAPQSYSEHKVDTRAPTCRSWPRGSWIYSRDTVGATQGGSSGSPVLNGAGQVVGQLSGACGYNLSDECDSGSNATVDGAFAAYFSQVSEWLDTDTAPVSGGNQPPVANFSFVPDGLSVAFTDTSTDPDGNTDITGWQWDFGDNSGSSNSQDTSYTYSAAGTFTVSLTVTDGAGASDTNSAAVTVDGGSGETDTVTVTGFSSTVDCASRGRWTANVSITISEALTGATVSGSWGGQAKGSGSCTIEGTSCQVSKKGLKSGGSATFEVTNIQFPGYTFLPGNDTEDILNTSCQ